MEIAEEIDQRDIVVVTNWLQSKGWELIKNSYLSKADRILARRFDGVPRCCTNQDKPLSLFVYLWDHPKYDADAFIGVWLELRAEPSPGAGWVTFSAYGFKPEELDRQCDRLLKAWSAICPFS